MGRALTESPATEEETPGPEKLAHADILADFYRMVTATSIRLPHRQAWRTGIYDKAP